MTDDRKLMELAACAAGIQIEWLPHCPNVPVLRGTGTWWNPRDDDGDSFRLLVALRLRIRFMGPRAVTVEQEILPSCFAELATATDGDAFRAARRAVLNAAAAIEVAR